MNRIRVIIDGPTIKPRGAAATAKDIIEAARRVQLERLLRGWGWQYRMVPVPVFDRAPRATLRSAVRRRAVS